LRLVVEIVSGADGGMERHIEFRFVTLCYVV
jgi:hypothetical protein